MIVERIRTKKGASGHFGTKFDLKKFKSLDGIQIMNSYAQQLLEKMGQGSSRAAYLLSSKYVLKIAINNKGLAQNEAEVDVFTNPKSKPVVAKVYASDDEFRWLISDLVNPLKNGDEFTKLTGVDFEEFMDQLNRTIKGGELPSDAPELLKATLATARQNKLMFGDLEEPGHWGKTPDGRIVLLDYGFTGEVWEKHYTDSNDRKHVDQDARTAGAQDTKTAKQNRVARSTTLPAARNEKTVDDKRGRGVNPYGKTSLAGRNAG